MANRKQNPALGTPGADDGTGSGLLYTPMLPQPTADVKTPGDAMRRLKDRGSELLDDLTLGIEPSYSVELVQRVLLNEFDAMGRGDANRALMQLAAIYPPGVREQFVGYLNLQVPADVAPALPVEIPFAAGHCQFLADYVAYGRAISPMTPDDFHESAALALGALAIARRLFVPMAYGDIYPNLFIAWLAPTTIFTKTTALNAARAIAAAAIPHLVGPSEVTFEGLVSDLAGKEPTGLNELKDEDQVLWRRERAFCAQRGMVLDELSGLLASAGRDYNSGLIEGLLRFYDCDRQYTRSTRGQGRIIVKNSYLTLLGASTPRAMAWALGNDRLWSVGWWRRFVILTPEVERPAWALPGNDTTGPAMHVTGKLRGLYNLLPEPIWPDGPAARCVTLAGEAMDLWQVYNKTLRYDLQTDDLDDRLRGSYGHMPTMALKVAAILAFFNWQPGGDPRIDIPEIGQAIAICERWRASLHRALAMAAATDFEAIKTRILRQVARAGIAGASLRDIAKGMRDKTPNELGDAIEQLVDIGELDKVENQSSSKGGRRSFRFVLASE